MFGILRLSSIVLVLIGTVMGLGSTIHWPTIGINGRGCTGSEMDWDVLYSRANFEDQGAFGLVDAEEAYALATGEGQRIAVIDGGFDLNHEAFDNVAIADQRDFIDGDNNPSEARDGIDQDGVDGPDSMFGHGTAVASLVTHLAPDATLLLYRVMDEEGNASVNNIRYAIYRAVSMNASVINISIGIDSNSPLLAAAVQFAYLDGVVVVAASGNGTGTISLYPGAYPEAICASASTLNDTLLATAINGPAVDMLAPGENILVAAAEHPTAYVEAQGTSFASPIIAATAALVRERYPSYGPTSVKNRLQSTAVQLTLTPSEIAQGLCGKRVDMDAAAQ